MEYNLLLNNPANSIHTLHQRLHPRSITQPHEMMARRIKQIPTLTRVQIEEDTRHNNDLLLQTSLEEVQPIIDRIRQIGKIQPEIKRRIRHEGELEADFLKTTDDVVALVAEMGLEGSHLVADAGRLEHLNGGFLEGHVAASVEVGAAGTDGVDEFFGAENPGDTPARETEALGEAVNDEDIVFVDVFDVVSGGDDGAVTVGGVVVTAVEFVHDQGGAVTADVLDLGEFWVGDHLTGGVSGVGGEDD